MAFRLQGKVLPVVQELNHYGITLGKLISMYKKLVRSIMYLELKSITNNEIVDQWKHDNPDVEYTPELWLEIQNTIQPIVWIPLATNLIRMRQLDLDKISEFLDNEIDKRLAFIDGYNNDTIYEFIN